MAEAGSWKANLEPRVADQVAYIIDAFDKEGIKIDAVTAPGGFGYVYARDQLLVRDEDLPRVLGIVRRLAGTDRDPDGAGRERDEPRRPQDDASREQDEPRRPQDDAGREQDDADRALDDAGRVERVIAGVVRLSLRGTGLTVPGVLDVIDQELGAGVATPDHVLTVAGEVDPCSATEPEEVYDGIEPAPSACPGSGGAGVLVYVADTGLLAGAAQSHAWLAGVGGDVDKLPPRTSNGTQRIPPYAGHGTFVAGVARCVAPAADVIVTDAFKIAGSALESHLVRHLDAALGLGVDIFHLSIATQTRADLPLIAFEAWLRLLRQYKGVVCVVAAGNNGSRRPSWPAAFADVVSVGALAGDWRSRASFSNFGGWVDVYAPGRDLVNAYATGTYTCYVTPYRRQARKFYGMAKWSGTSFSAPVVTGLIADRMYRTGENGQQAAAALLAEARSEAIAGVGAILLPCCPGSDARPARPQSLAGVAHRYSGASGRRGYPDIP